MAGLLLLAVACIKDEHLRPCPPLKVDIEVKDKNYFNVDAVATEERRDEQLPFRAFVPTLYYRLQLLNADGTATLMTEHQLAEVEGDAQHIAVTFPDEYPHGTYVMSTIGGLRDMTGIADDLTYIDFHPDNNKGVDVYVSQDTLVYDAYRHDYTVGLERAKGKLNIECYNLPPEITFSEKEIRNVAQTLDCEYNFYGLTSVITQYDWVSSPNVTTKTISAPSLTEKGTSVLVNLFDTPEMEIPHLVFPTVHVTIERNKITALKYVYEPPIFKVYLLVDDNWELVHDMDIE